MSYWVYLQDKHGDTVSVDCHSEGGTYAVGGTGEACVNITYNYGRDFWRAWEEVGGPDSGNHGSLPSMIHGQRARDVLPYLEKAVEVLGTERSNDYWESTAGNAGYALSILRDWARQHPDAVFEVH